MQISEERQDIIFEQVNNTVPSVWQMLIGFYDPFGAGHNYEHLARMDSLREQYGPTLINLIKFF